MTAFTLDFPALGGRIVTERHARVCVEQGHASHVINGVDSETCPRCGDVKGVARVEKFDNILDLEQVVRLTMTAAAFRGAGCPDFRVAQQATGLAADRARLSLAVDALTPSEAIAFGSYRLREVDADA